MRKTLAIITLCFASITSLYAVTMSNLYQAVIEVSSQAEDERSRAVKEGFTQILVKLTGNTQIENNPIIKVAIDKAQYYVQEFSYSTPDVSSSQYSLHISYDVNDVNSLLRKAKAEYWSGDRPLLLVWLTVSGNGHPVEIIGDESAGDLSHQMKQQGTRYGLPLIFPLMDVADISQVSAEDINEMNLALLKEAGKRYAPTGLLIGHIEAVNHEWQSDWQMAIGNTHWRFKITGQSSDDVLAEILKQVSNTLAKQYIIKPDDTTSTWLELEVTHVFQSDDLSQLIQYLKQLSIIQQVKLAQISGDTVDLSVQVRGSLANFQQKVTVLQKLVFVTQEADNNKLVYEWVH